MTRIRRTSWLLLSTRSWRQHADAPANRARLCSGRWTVPLQAELFIVSAVAPLGKLNFHERDVSSVVVAIGEQRCFQPALLLRLWAVAPPASQQRARRTATPAFTASVAICRMCNLQNPKSLVGFESHPLRQTRQHSCCCGRELPRHARNSANPSGKGVTYIFKRA